MTTDHARLTAYAEANKRWHEKNGDRGPISTIIENGRAVAELHQDDLDAVLAELADTRADNEQLRGNLSRQVDEIGALRDRTGALVTQTEQLAAEVEQFREAAPEEPVDDVVQLVVPVGPVWDSLKAALKRMGLLVAGPIPVEDPIKTYVLQPIDWRPAVAEPTATRAQDGAENGPSEA